MYQKMDLVYTHNLGLRIIMIGTQFILKCKDHKENRTRKLCCKSMEIPHLHLEVSCRNHSTPPHVNTNFALELNRGK